MELTSELTITSRCSDRSTSLIQSAAYGNLFECSTHEENGCDIVFSSMSHENEVGVMDDGEELLLTSLLENFGKLWGQTPRGLQGQVCIASSMYCVKGESEKTLFGSEP